MAEQMQDHISADVGVLICARLGCKGHGKVCIKQPVLLRTTRTRPLMKGAQAKEGMEGCRKYGFCRGGLRIRQERKQSKSTRSYQEQREGSSLLA